MDTVTISKQQHQLHMISEAVALLITVPFLFYVSENLPTEKGRRAARYMAYGALLVDGVLLFRFVTGTSDRPIL